MSLGLPRNFDKAASVRRFAAAARAMGTAEAAALPGLDRLLALPGVSWMGMLADPGGVSFLPRETFSAAVGVALAVAAPGGTRAVPPFLCFVRGRILPGSDGVPDLRPALVSYEASRLPAVLAAIVDRAGRGSPGDVGETTNPASPAGDPGD